MDDKSSIYKIHLCRICQNPSELDLVSTADSSEGKSCLDTLKHIFCEIVWVEDCLLSFICRTCLKRIYETAQFKQLCLESQTRREDFNSKYIELVINEPISNNTDTPQRNSPEVIILEPATQIEELILPYNNDEVFIKTEKIDDVVEDGLGEMQQPKAVICIEEIPSLSLKRKVESTSLPNGYNKTYKIKKFGYIPSSVKMISTRLSEYMPRINPRSHETECTDCKRIFSTGFELRDHIVAQHNHKTPRKYRCESCHIGFATSSEFVYHYKKLEHLEHVPLQCSTCGCKTIRRHTDTTETTNISCLCPTSNGNEKPKKKVWKILCMKCNDSFPTLLLAKEHSERIHNTADPFGCTKCDIVFISKKLLKEHNTKHHQLNCGQCVKTFDGISALSTHRRLAHRPRYSVVNVIPSPQGLHCLLCKRVFLTRNSLETHIESRACELYSICGLCGATFHESRIKRHLVMIHGISGTKKEDFEQHFVRKVLAKQKNREPKPPVATMKCEQYRECNLCSKYLHVSRMKVHLIYSHQIDVCDKNFKLQSYYKSKTMSLQKVKEKIEVLKRTDRLCDIEHSYSLKQKKLVDGINRELY